MLIETDLRERGLALIEQRKAAAELTESLRAAKAKWEAENAALIAKEKAQREVVEQAESDLREKMVLYYGITGNKTFENAFEIRMTPVLNYESDSLLAWLLNAPRQLAQQLLMVDKKKAEMWLKERKTEGGAIMPVPFCDPVPALFVEKAVGAILTKGLEALRVVPEEHNPTLALTTPEAAIKESHDDTAA